ncbi:two component transcriptional regulator, winged helix family [mine drainage metagenome]|uniref:Two component transcriptional regulator, winged helix family n=1 Tax=mine drainage metagenome TaxID=410659 RepID=T1CIG9_9ZZZZ
MNTLPIRVLVIDDDLRIRALLEEYLREEGYQVRTLNHGLQIEEELAVHKPDLIILDIMLPREDGLTICRRLRGQGIQIPIIMLTAKGEPIERIVGLEIGADDYVAKPFNPRELLARIKAILRRRNFNPPPGAPATEDLRVRFGPFEFNRAKRCLTRGAELIPLTTSEFAVLEALVSHARIPLNREQLLELARGRAYTAFDRSMDVQISRLRHLIEEDRSSPRYLQTVRGYGYVFIPDDPEPA